MTALAPIVRAGVQPWAAQVAFCEVKIAALYVQTGGGYWNLPGVDPWDAARDARLYAGPHPVVAHPPCERWGRYWGGSPTTWPRLVKGDDGGCFAAALAAVRRWGGVLEHPEGSAAWPAHGLLPPPRTGGWVAADWPAHRGWTCCVEQGAYGHKARKATWLYACGVPLPQLRWGAAEGEFVRPINGEDRARAVKIGICQRLSKRQRAATPPEFRDVLLAIAAGLPIPASPWCDGAGEQPRGGVVAPSPDGHAAAGPAAAASCAGGAAPTRAAPAAFSHR